MFQRFDLSLSLELIQTVVAVLMLVIELQRFE